MIILSFAHLLQRGEVASVCEGENGKVIHYSCISDTHTAPLFVFAYSLLMHSSLCDMQTISKCYNKWRSGKKRHTHTHIQIELGYIQHSLKFEVQVIISQQMQRQKGTVIKDSKHEGKMTERRNSWSEKRVRLRFPEAPKPLKYWPQLCIYAHKNARIFLHIFRHILFTDIFTEEIITYLSAASVAEVVADQVLT